MPTFPPLRTAPCAHAPTAPRLRRPTAASLWLIGTALLAGCATAPAPETRGSTVPDLPAAWTGPADAASASGGSAVAPPAALSAAEAAALAQWWLQFDDPLLGELVTQALHANLDLATAQARLEQARALRDGQAAQAAPQLGSSAGITQSRNRAGASERWNAGLDASWEPDVFGRQAQALRARDWDLTAARAQREATRTAVAAEVGIAYVSLRSQQQQWRIAGEHLAAQQQTQALVGWRAQAGLVASLEAEQARGATAQLRASLPALRDAIAQSEHRLALLLGQPPTALRARLGAGAALPSAGAPLPLGVPADLLRRRPDLQAAEATLRAEAERLGLAQAQRWPSLRLSGSLTLQAATLAGLSGAGAWAAAAAAAIDGTLWDGGARDAAIGQQRAQLAAARIAARAALLTALEDVENALGALGAAQRQSEALAEAREAAHRALLLARHRWQAGLVDFGTLLEAQRSALSADSSQVAARRDEQLARIRLYKALGGGWEAGAVPQAPSPPLRTP